MRIGKPGFLYAVLILFISVFGSNKASADTMKLNGVGPTGTVDLSSSAYGYSNLDVYAGILNWTDTSTNPNTSLGTYCIDVAAIIYIGNSYNFTNEPFTTATQWDNSENEASSTPLFSSPVTNAIENLWSAHYSDGGDTATATSADAGQFQVALWDIIYNYDPILNRFVEGSGLQFSSANGFDLTTAEGWAANAYAAGTYKGDINLTALVATDGSQNQAIYAGVAPLPSVASTGMVLLAGIACFAFLRRRQLVQVAIA